MRGQPAEASPALGSEVLQNRIGPREDLPRRIPLVEPLERGHHGLGGLGPRLRDARIDRTMSRVALQPDRCLAQARVALTQRMKEHPADDAERDGVRPVSRGHRVEDCAGHGAGLLHEPLAQPVP